MKPEENSQQPWLTRDFESRFRQAFGREMSPEERTFFGLEVSVDGHAPNSERTAFTHDNLRAGGAGS
jgi:hypothetical protein